MHDPLALLAKKLDALQGSVTQLLGDLEKQSRLEAKRLEEVAYGEEFDAREAPGQERIVAALAKATEAVERADDALSDAREALADAHD